MRIYCAARPLLFLHQQNQTKPDQMKTLKIDLLDVFVSQRPNLSFSDYGDLSAYRSDYAVILKGLHVFNELKGILTQCFERDEIEKALTLNLNKESNRLFLHNGELNYIVGQYFPTEYRGAACSALYSALRSLASKHYPEDYGVSFLKRKMSKGAKRFLGVF